MHPKAHQALTRFTLTAFASSLPEVIKSHAKEIIYGTRVEDHWWEPSRAMNWHFYRREGSPIPERTRWLKMRPTSEHIFAAHVEKMQRYGIDDPRRYRYLGRILHHIQDMSTPSHVRPVYHDPFVHDYFESFMVDMLPNLEPLIPSTDATPEDDLMSIYKVAAEATLRFMETYTVLATVNGRAEAFPLSVFWEDYTVNEDQKRPGFGQFGRLHGLFKAENRSQFMRCSDDVNCLIPLTELCRLNNIVCGKAVADTYRALICAAAESGKKR